MSDTYDVRVEVGPFTMDITFQFEGKNVVDKYGAENIDNVNLENIEVVLLRGDDYITRLDFSSIDELNLDLAQEKLVTSAEDLAFTRYINNSDNHVDVREYEADRYDYEER